MSQPQLHSPSKLPSAALISEAERIDDSRRNVGMFVRNSSSVEADLHLFDVFADFDEADAAVRAAGAQTSRFVRAEGGRKTKVLYLCGHAQKSAFSYCRKKREEEGESLPPSRGGKRSGGQLEEIFREMPEGKCGAFVQLQEVRAGQLLAGTWKR